MRTEQERNMKTLFSAAYWVFISSVPQKPKRNRSHDNNNICNLFLSLNVKYEIIMQFVKIDQ